MFYWQPIPYKYAIERCFPNLLMCLWMVVVDSHWRHHYLQLYFIFFNHGSHCCTGKHPRRQEDHERVRLVFLKLYQFFQDLKLPTERWITD